MKKISFTVSIIMILGLINMQNSFSNERKFTYIYQSDVLGKGFKELEITTTPMIGKNYGYYAELDNRMEFEVGVSKRLQTAFYINFSNITTDNGTGVNETHFNFNGISSEWKYQFFNPYIDAIGFAGYTEMGLNTDEVELETKLIFDKRIKNTILALNITYEPEWYLTPGQSETEHNFEGTFGVSYAFSPSLSAGIELRNHNIYTKENGWESSAFFAGPNISYSQPKWWVTLTVLPQIAAFKGKSPGSNLSLHDYTQFETRVIFSFHI